MSEYITQLEKPDCQKIIEGDHPTCRLFPNNKYWKETEGVVVGDYYLRDVSKINCKYNESTDSYIPVWSVGKWEKLGIVVEYKTLFTKYGNHKGVYTDNRVFVQNRDIILTNIK